MILRTVAARRPAAAGARRQRRTGRGDADAPPDGVVFDGAGGCEVHKTISRYYLRSTAAALAHLAISNKNLLLLLLLIKLHQSRRLLLVGVFWNYHRRRRWHYLLTK